MDRAMAELAVITQQDVLTRDGKAIKLAGVTEFHAVDRDGINHPLTALTPSQDLRGTDESESGTPEE